jgi:hypothetical protein
MNEKLVDWSQVSAFRLARHHFLDQQPADLVEICSDLCVVQHSGGFADLCVFARNQSLRSKKRDSQVSRKDAKIRKGG